MKIKIIVAGALGRMGSPALETFLANSNKFELVACVVRSLDSEACQKAKQKHPQLKFFDNLEKALEESSADVLLELTNPDSVFVNTRMALEKGLRVVVGATGLSTKNIEELNILSKNKKLGVLIAPNFAIGAILMMQFAAQAVKYFNQYEIIELHHDKKVDAPSGTAIKTAELMKAAAANDQEIPIHSVRLAGLVAHQEVIFGAVGQTLTIRHDSIDRSSFMPGILLASEKVMDLDSLVYGLDKVI